MSSDGTIAFAFVDLVPKELDERTLYISVKYKNAIHKCPCGCGNRVVTPISPTGWALTFNGASVSLHPSIGSWALPCRSHYWIEKNRIRWSREWSEQEVQDARHRERREKQEYYHEVELPAATKPLPPAAQAPIRRGILARFGAWLRGDR